MKTRQIFLLALMLISFAGCKKDKAKAITPEPVKEEPVTKPEDGNPNQSPITAQSIRGKVICGYQGWFNAAGDGSTINRWFHWAGTTAPAPQHLSFELYPDVQEYNGTSLFQTGFANLGNGQPSVLFSSYKTDVVDKHFAWMEANGIDGVGLQRFNSDLLNPASKTNRDAIAVSVKNAAEAHGRLFYVMYDVSGLASDKFSTIFSDWQNNIVNTMHLPSSPKYAYEGGKPVVCIWGFGFTSRNGTAEECLAVIKQFKDAGCYVIGGVPRYWRTVTGDSKPGFENVYKAFNMLSPWTVGAFGDQAGADNYKNTFLLPDKASCDANGIAYQPVMFSGFAWSNWNGGAKNIIPRNKGEFLWRQVANIKSSGISSAYVAMFDEYDEATAIAKAADSYFSVPTNQYFLTTSADGTYLSSDFYLRLIGKATRVIKGLDQVTTTVPIRYSEGPVWFRSSFEADLDAQPSWISTVNASANFTNPGLVVRNGEKAHSGTSSLLYSGTANGSASTYCYFKTLQLNITIGANTVLEYWVYPEQDNARYIAIDFHCTDGTSLRDAGALDQNGKGLHPAAGHGGAIPLNAWSMIKSTIGSKLAGKTVDMITIGFDRGGATGAVSGYLDDIKITDGNIN